MSRIILTFIFIFSMKVEYGQNHMQSIEQLINKEDPGWALVQEWIARAKNKVEVLPCDSVKAREALYKVQVTTRSPMGAIVFTTGGIIVDNGWIRILGSGSERLSRSLPDWNKGKSFKEFGDPATYYLVADDAAGGFFAINGGLFGNDKGKMYYLAPDNLEWEPLDLGYSAFLDFCFNGDLDEFYKGLRWNGWKDDVAKLDGTMVFNFVPVLWTKEGKDINKASKEIVPVEEQFGLNMEFRKQLGMEKNTH